ncbi:MAG: hypothetical protein KJ795_15260 [Gammaproteobacteria bacterium]|nr:hypothetical protein [Gammaproteobacteria bacterium]MBU1968536.1 hypothetical protein [Gammaproteobacteria bacterium]
MKLAAGSAMLGMLLSGSVLAQNSGADPAPAKNHDQVATAQADRPAKTVIVQQGKAKLKVKSSAAKRGTTSVSAEQGSKTEAAEKPDDAAEQSVQIKGVRG